MEVLHTLQGSSTLTDVRDQSALESALYHLPTVFAEETLPAVAVSFAAISIRDASALLSSPTLKLSPTQVSKLTGLIGRLTSKINKTVKSIKPRKNKKNILGRNKTRRNIH